MFGSVFFLLFLTTGLVSGNTCPEQRGAYALCSTTVLYILDTSQDISHANIVTEFDWIRNNIIPGTAWGTSQRLALISYGTGNLQSLNPTGSRVTACKQLDALENMYNFLGSDNVTLYNTMQSVNLFYKNKTDNMVLFSSSRDVADIAMTADYIRQTMTNEQITVIALGGANFTGFPARVIYDVDNLTTAPPNLPSCIIKNACDQGATCESHFPSFQVLDCPEVGSCYQQFVCYCTS